MHRPTLQITLSALAISALSQHLIVYSVSRTDCWHHSGWLLCRGMHLRHGCTQRAPQPASCLPQALCSGGKSHLVLSSSVPGAALGWTAEFRQEMR